LVRRAIATSVKRLFENEAGVIAGRSVEVVHQARVAVRRLRSDLRAFRSLLDRDWSAPLRQELAWLGTELGAVRDFDVLLARLRSDAERAGGMADPNVKSVFERLRSDRAQARKRLLTAMRTDRYRQLRDRLQSAMRAPHFTLAARMTALDALVPIVWKGWKKLRSAVKRLTPRPSASALHRVRILAKRCRHAAESVIPLEGKRAASFAEAAARVQDALGELNDAETACRALRRLRRKPDMALAANALLALESDAAARARSMWPGAWRALDVKGLRAWL
jgi:CHAD domain-containing protein